MDTAGVQNNGYCRRANQPMGYGMARVKRVDLRKMDSEERSFRQEY